MNRRRYLLVAMWVVTLTVVASLCYKSVKVPSVSFIQTGMPKSEVEAVLGKGSPGNGRSLSGNYMVGYGRYDFWGNDYSIDIKYDKNDEVIHVLVDPPKRAKWLQDIVDKVPQRKVPQTKLRPPS